MEKSTNEMVVESVLCTHADAHGSNLNWNSDNFNLKTPPSTDLFVASEFDSNQHH